VDSPRACKPRPSFRTHTDGLNTSPNMDAVNRTVRAALVRLEVAPIHHTIAFGVNRRFKGDIRNWSWQLSIIRSRQEHD
jgi:hypothetical protein